VVLFHKPTANVLVTEQAPPQLLLNGKSKRVLTFTAKNWDLPQTVIVGFKKGSAGAGTQYVYITHKVTSKDKKYNKLKVKKLRVKIADHITPGQTVQSLINGLPSGPGDPALRDKTLRAAGLPLGATPKPAAPKPAAPVTTTTGGATTASSGSTAGTVHAPETTTTTTSTTTTTTTSTTTTSTSTVHAPEAGSGTGPVVGAGPIVTGGTTTTVSGAHGGKPAKMMTPPPTVAPVATTAAPKADALVDLAQVASQLSAADDKANAAHDALGAARVTLQNEATALADVRAAETALTDVHTSASAGLDRTTADGLKTALASDQATDRLLARALRAKQVLTAAQVSATQSALAATVTKQDAAATAYGEIHAAPKTACTLSTTASHGLFTTALTCTKRVLSITEDVGRKLHPHGSGILDAGTLTACTLTPVDKPQRQSCTGLDIAANTALSVIARDAAKKCDQGSIAITFADGTQTLVQLVAPKPPHHG
jgi:hypothetical protein